MRTVLKRLIQGFVFLILCTVFINVPCRIPAEAATDLNSFPESYRPYIQQLQSQHPKWEFKAYNTNIKWSDLTSYENGHAVNLIENTNPETWFARGSGYYDSQTGKYTVLSSPNWVQPSEGIVSYFLDPRNFLNEEDVFMFESLDYNAALHTEATVNTVLKGSWMYQRPLEDDASMTYAQALIKIGREIGVSPFLLASRLVQEQGTGGTSPLISGTYPGFEGYYNYFNISASGGSYGEIYRNGLTEAKNAGWNTRYKALYGGAQKVSQNYVKRGQNTLYFQKFDVVDGLSWHQYMQNLQAPYSEGRRIRSAYINCGLLENAFTFLIPVYTGMPASACPLPGDFDEVEMTTTLNYPTLHVEIGNVQYAGSVQKMEVAVWNIGVTSPKWFTMTYQNGRWTADVNLANISQETGSYAAHVYINGKFVWEKITVIDESYIGNFDEATLTTSLNYPVLHAQVADIAYPSAVSKMEVAVWNIGVTEPKWFTMTKHDGKWTADVNLTDCSRLAGRYAAHAYVTNLAGKKVFIGETISVVDESMVKTDLLYGDVNGDGVINAADALMVLRHAARISVLQDSFLSRADCNIDGTINAVDALKILRIAARIE